MSFVNKIVIYHLEISEQHAKLVKRIYI